MLQSPLLKLTQGYINGKWCAADAASIMPVINPATGETIAMVPAMGRGETTRAVEAAVRALATPAAIELRSRWLRDLADLITQHRAELGRIITHEHGKPLAEATGEADYAASFFRFYSGCVDHLKPKQLTERPRNHIWTVYYRPAGRRRVDHTVEFPTGDAGEKVFRRTCSRLLLCD
jgi:succinate-semialdehyde dehydrogenase/glutarate-semialdehyde dehydrogenase